MTTPARQPAAHAGFPPVAAVLLVVAVITSACTLGGGGGLLGGRDKCWANGDPRLASIWRGVLAIDVDGAFLLTPEGESIALLPGRLFPRVGEDGVGVLLDGDRVAAQAGQDVTVFGGAAADGLVACAIEEIHPDS